MKQKAIRIAMLAAFLSAAASAGTLYSFTSFDGPGNNAGGTTVNGINNNGAVVGFSADNAAFPTLLTNFVRAPNGVFSVLNINNDPFANANGINSAGTVVGFSNNEAFRLSGAFNILPAVNGTTTSETAFGINDPGVIVGQFTDGATDTVRGFVYGAGAFTILNPVINATVTNAQGINNAGLVAGFYSLDGVHQHGFFYNSATSQFTLPPDPAVPNLVLTQFLGINDNGIAVGYYELPDGSQHGFLYALATHSYSFLDDPNAAVGGFSVTQITGINNANEIAGFYIDAASGLQRGFIAAPVGVAPEPATHCLVLAALLAVSGSWRRRRN